MFAMGLIAPIILILSVPPPSIGNKKDFDFTPVAVSLLSAIIK